VFRGIFQYKALEDGTLQSPNTFRLRGWNVSMNIRSVYLLNISQQPTMNEPYSWNTNDENFEFPHSFSEFIDENTVYNGNPRLFFKNNLLCWDIPYYLSGHYWNQSRTNDPLPSEPSNDGYEFKFFVEENPDTNTISGAIKARVSNSIDDFAPGEMAGLVVHDIDTAGQYRVLMNFDDSTPTILERKLL
jgi:hypothetical protein